MKKNMRFLILILLTVLLFSIQTVYADGISLKRVDNSVLKNMENFNVVTIHPPYMNMLGSVKYIDKNAFSTKVKEISLRLYSGMEDSVSTSYRTEQQRKYYLEVSQKNKSAVFEFENILRLKDIRHNGMGSSVFPIVIEVKTSEPQKDNGRAFNEDSTYHIRLGFKDRQTLSLTSLYVDVIKLPRIPVDITGVTSSLRYGNLLARAINYNIYEGPSFLIVELYEGTSEFPESVIASKRIDVYSNELTSNEYKKLTGESSYGIGPSNVQWEGLMLRYKIGIGGKRFSCALNGLDDNNFESYCSLDVR